MKRVAKMRVPAPSKITKINKMDFKSSTTPPSCSKLNVSERTSRSLTPTFIPTSNAKKVAKPVTPNPPTWINTKITTSPKVLKVRAVSCTTSPVTQTDEVAENRASNKEDRKSTRLN